MSIFSKFFKKYFSKDSYVFEDLYDAIETSDLDMVREIISINPKLVFGKDEYGFTIVHAVASTDNEEIAKLILSYKIDVNSKNEDGITPIHNVMYPNIAQILIDSGANINITDNGGNTPLHIQASDGEERNDVIEVLLKSGADKKILNKQGERAYDIAIIREEEDNASILK